MPEDSQAPGSSDQAIEEAKKSQLTGVERRIAARRPLRSSVIVGIAGAPLIHGRSIDISASGLGLIAPVDVRASVRCRIAFSLMLKNKTMRQMDLTGVVVYSALSSKYGAFQVGIQFVDLLPESSFIISQYVNG